MYGITRLTGLIDLDQIGYYWGRQAAAWPPELWLSITAAAVGNLLYIVLYLGKSFFEAAIFLQQLMGNYSVGGSERYGIAHERCDCGNRSSSVKSGNPSGLK